MYRISNCEFRKAKTKKADQEIGRSDKHNSNFELRIAESELRKPTEVDQDIRRPGGRGSGYQRIRGQNTRISDYQVTNSRFVIWSSGLLMSCFLVSC